jgi:hypothetical protein
MSKFWMVLLCLAPLVFADSERTKLTVQVNAAENDKPVSRASVIVRFRHGRNPVNMKKITTSWETKTGENGQVTIPIIPQGEITIQVIASGRQTFGGVYQLDQDEQTINIKLNPPQPQYSEDAKKRQ